MMNTYFEDFEISVLNNVTCIAVHCAFLQNLVQRDDGLIRSRNIVTRYCLYLARHIHNNCTGIHTDIDHTSCYYGDQIKEDSMGRPYGTHWSEEKCLQGIG